jgi:hypothetical protein
MRWWKAVGLAGVAGVAATGVVVARDQRRRRSFTPDEIRQRLHSRLEEQDASGQGAVQAGSAGAASGPEAEPEDLHQRRGCLRRARRRQKT